ncbi:MAG: hypothetical protein M3083_15305 [Actinomycetota bacterium]|nr:hypothetical protein [Actinomycetota bacterium]MDQ6946321.1 hypothetical protein [Actinomycetota bacterium]
MTDLAAPELTRPTPGTERTVDAIRLTGWFDEINDSVRALLFGQMVARAWGIEHFHSDLFHDARWLAQHVTGPTTFYWAPRTWGSDIGTDRCLVATPSDGKALYRVELLCEDGLWSAVFTTEPVGGQ